MLILLLAQVPAELKEIKPVGWPECGYLMLHYSLLCGGWGGWHSGSQTASDANVVSGNGLHGHMCLNEPGAKNTCFPGDVIRKGPYVWCILMFCAAIQGPKAR